MCCIVIDFDGTLASFLSGREGFFDIFIKRGVPENVVKESYETVKASKGFSIESLCNMLNTKGFSLSKDALESDFETWVQKDLALYPDSMMAVKNWKKQGIPIIILTAGEEVTQRQKVAVTQIPYDELCVVPTAKEKVAEVSRLLEKYGKPLLMLDDRADILDMVKEAFGDSSGVSTVWVHRVNSDFPRGKHEHIEIKDLSAESLAQVMS